MKKSREPLLPKDFIGKERWTRDDAIAVMCRSLAGLLEYWGCEGDAEAVRFAEHVLRQPPLVDVTGALHELQIENDELKEEIRELRERLAEQP